MRKFLSWTLPVLFVLLVISFAGCSLESEAADEADRIVIPPLTGYDINITTNDFQWAVSDRYVTKRINFEIYGQSDLSGVVRNFQNEFVCYSYTSTGSYVDVNNKRWYTYYFYLTLNYIYATPNTWRQNTMELVKSGRAVAYDVIQIWVC